MIPVIALSASLFVGGVVFGYWTLPRAFEFFLSIFPEDFALEMAGGNVELVPTFGRGYLQNAAPAIALFRDGELVYMLERSRIENQTAEQIAAHVGLLGHTARLRARDRPARDPAAARGARTTPCPPGTARDCRRAAGSTSPPRRTWR